MQVGPPSFTAYKARASECSLWSMQILVIQLSYMDQLHWPASALSTAASTRPCRWWQFLQCTSHSRLAKPATGLTTLRNMGFANKSSSFALRAKSRKLSDFWCCSNATIFSNLLVWFSPTRCEWAVHLEHRRDGGMKCSILFNHNYIFTAILTIYFSMSLISKCHRFVIMDVVGEFC